MHGMVERGFLCVTALDPGTRFVERCPRTHRLACLYLLRAGLKACVTMPC